MNRKTDRRNGKSKYVGTILKDFEIVDYIPAHGKQNAQFVGKCIHCGNIITRSASGFKQEHSRITCPCQEKYSHHEKSYTRLYRTYQNMKRRCYNPNNTFYKGYGGRGIRVCDEWLGKYGFNHFMDWALSHGYADNLSIDRIDVDGNYEPSNCRWTTVYKQNLNKTNTLYATINGVTKPVVEWCKDYGVAYSCVKSRARRGMSYEDAITKPVMRKGG
ncbi:MAG: hypothetical protein Q4E29_08565 [Lachnospiraceae bacterium]|nr:hypothetical protein [Lachnospiraceae bacterium]